MSTRNRQPVRAGTATAAPAATAAPEAQTPSSAAPIVSATNEAEAVVEQTQVDADAGDIEDLVEGRVIVAFDDYQPNDVFVGSADDARALETEMRIDCDPKAVAYAKSLSEG